MSKKIRVLSLDFDGCLAEANKLKTIDEHIEYNKDFLAFLNQDKANYDKSIVFLGSNRQSIAMDQENGFSKKNGSCYALIEAIAKKLSAVFDPLLLADVYADEPAGTTIETAKKLLGSDQFYQSKEVAQQQSDWVEDKGKLTILLAQMHKVASEHQEDDEIVYEFFDDQEVILNKLKNYFDNNPEAIPKNITLKLNKYTGKVNEVSNQLVDNIATISGKGTAKNYCSLIWDLLNLGYQNKKMDIATMLHEVPMIHSTEMLYKIQTDNRPFDHTLIVNFNPFDFYKPNDKPEIRQAFGKTREICNKIDEQIVKMEKEFTWFKSSPAAKIAALKDLKALLISKQDEPIEKILNEWFSKAGGEIARSDNVSSTYKSSVQQIISQHRNVFKGEYRPHVKTSTEKFIDSLYLEFSSKPMETKVDMAIEHNDPEELSETESSDDDRGINLQ